MSKDSCAKGIKIFLKKKKKNKKRECGCERYKNLRNRKKKSN